MRMSEASRAAPLRKTIRVAAFAMALLAPALGGCVTQTTQIEQGRAISTGKQPYDQFFEAVRALREASLHAKQEVVDARANLARTLGLDARVDAEAAVEAAHARAGKLRESGVLLHLELTPDAKLVSTKGRGAVQRDEKDVIEAVEASVKTSLVVSQRLGEISKRAAELESKRSALRAESDVIFANDPKRRQVARELAAAGPVLTEAGALGDRYAGIASKFVLDLAHAVETGADPGSSGPASRAATPRGSPRRPIGSAAAPKRGPAPQQRGGDDFDP
jgi:hypothetical protein